MKLGEIFIKKGLITQSQLEQALHAQLIYGGHLGTCLIEQGMVNEEQLGRVLSDSFKVPYAAVDRFENIPRSVIQSLPARSVEKVHAVPFERHGKTLTVAMIDPTNLPSLDELAFASGCKIDPWVAPEARILQAMERYYDIPRRQRYIAVCRDLDSSTTGPQARPDGIYQSSAPVSASGETLAGFVPPGEQGGPAIAPAVAQVTPGLVPLAAANADLEDETEAHPAAPPATPPAPRPGAAAAAAAVASPAPAAPARPAAAAVIGPRPVAAPPRAPAKPAPAATPKPVPRPVAVPAPHPVPQETAKPAPGAEAQLLPAAPINWSAMRDEVPRTSEDRLSELFCSAENVEILAEVVLDHTVHSLQRCILFNVKGTTAVIWGSRGLHLNQDKAANVSIAITQEPIFHLFLDEGLYRGPLPEEIGYQRFYDSLGISRPNEVVVIPIYLEDRLVAIFYGDSGDRPEINGETEEFRRMLRKLSIALNLVVLKRKIRSL
jgi:hypothetical protein